MSLSLPLASVLAPYQNSGLGLSQQAFRAELERGGATLAPVSLGVLEAMSEGHAFQGILLQARGDGYSAERPAAWTVDFEKFRGDSKAREVCGHGATLGRQGYIPESTASLLIDPFLTVASVVSGRPSAFRLAPSASMASLASLSGLLQDEAWPLYTGLERVRIHGYWASAYGAAVHDLLHYVAWKRWSEEDRKDSVVLYGAMKSVVTSRLPSLGSLAGRLGARLFYGDEFFYREMTAMDECLSGPPGQGAGTFAEASLQNVVTYLESDRSRFCGAVEKAFSGHPRASAWREAVRRVRN